VFVTSLGSCILLSIVPVLLAVLTAISFKLIITPIPPESLGDVQLAIVLTGMIVAVRIVGHIGGGTLVAMKRFDLNNITAVIAQIIQAGLQIYIVRRGGTLSDLAACILGMAVLTQVVQLLLAIKILGGVSLSPTYYEPTMLKQLLKFGVLNIVVHGSRRISDYAGAIIVGAFLGPVAIAFYSVAEGLQRHALALAKGVVSVIMPVSSQLDSQRRSDALVQMLINAPSMLLSMALFMVTMFVVLGRNIIDLWIDEPGYADNAYPILCVFSLAILVRMPANGVRSMMTGMGRVKFLSKLALIEAVVFFTLACVLVPFVGTIGVPWAMVVSVVPLSGVVLCVFACQEVGYSVSKFYIKTVLPPLGAAIPGLIAAVLQKAYYPPETLYLILRGWHWRRPFAAGLALVECGAIVGIVSAISVFFIAMSPKMRRDIFGSLIPDWMTASSWDGKKVAKWDGNKTPGGESEVA
jgi:O-antigen/teichoic acid export membrane protein